MGEVGGKVEHVKKHLKLRVADENLETGGDEVGSSQDVAQREFASEYTATLRQRFQELYKGKTQNRNTHFVDVEVCVRDVRVDGCRQ